MNRKATEAYPPADYELFNELQADMDKFHVGLGVHVAQQFGCHVEWNPRLLHVERDAYRETGASYRRRHMKQTMD